MSELSHDEIQQYSRHLILPEVGVSGQIKLKKASVLVVGAGGLGSPLGLYLAAAGIGRIGIVDHDVVEHSNLHRQILYGKEDIGRSKLESARDRLKSLNPNVEIELHEVKLSSSNALELFKNYDVIADGTDNYPTRYLIGDACVLLKKPCVYGSISRFEGQVSVFDSNRGPCYRCLYPEPPPPGSVPSCVEGGVLGVLPGVIGTLQATEVIKTLLGIGDSMVGRLLLFDALSMKFRELKLQKNPDCEVCSEKATIKELVDHEVFCGIESHDEGKDVPEMSAKELQSILEAKKTIVLLDVRETPELEICKLDGVVHIPLREITQRMTELNSSEEIVVICRRGIRSLKAARQLKEAGFENVTNLRGGMTAWAEEVDPSVPKY